MVHLLRSSTRCRLFLLAVGLLFGLTVSATAQSRDDGSLYSRFGLGELRLFTTSQAQAMGGGGTALWSFNYANFGNPATWGHQVLVRASAGIRFDGLEITDADNNTKRLSNGSLNAVQFSLPLRTNKLGVGFGFEPYSRTNYRVQTTGALITDPTIQDTTLYQISYEGTGGLQQVRGGIGYRITDNLSLGASVDVIFGIIEEGQRTTFESFDFIETNLAASTRMFGVTGTLGALFTTSDLLSENDNLMIAAAFTLPASLNGDRALTLGESLDRDTLGTEIEGTLDLPYSARFGLAYVSNNRWTFVADARYEPWSEFKSELSLPGYTPDGTSLFQDRLRLSGGVEWLPAGSDQLEPFLKRVAYRFGFYYDQAYVTPVANADINTIALTGGFSIPGLLPGTRLDINFEAGTRGTTDQQLVRDTFYGVSATFNIGERWFLKRKLR
ncbi:MAG: OmpP1/FadL family transporter [Rhodothermales bacterium]